MRSYGLVLYNTSEVHSYLQVLRHGGCTVEVVWETVSAPIRSHTFISFTSWGLYRRGQGARSLPGCVPSAPISLRNFISWNNISNIVRNL